MAALAVKQSAFQALSPRDKRIVRGVGHVLALGQPAVYDGAGSVWFVFDDHRFKAVHIAYLGCLLANLGDIPAGYQVPDDLSVLAADVKTFCDDPTRTNPLVKPGDVTFAEGGNPYQDILDAQNAPPSVRMASGVPDSWTPKEVSQ